MDIRNHSANLTFFKINQCGFFKRQNKYGEDLGIDTLLGGLKSWVDNLDKLYETLPWNNDIAGYYLKKKIYCKEIIKNPTTGDYLLVLWRSVADSNGNIYGLDGNSSLGNSNLISSTENNKTKSIIWGQPIYYWFIPSLNIYASIKFNDTISDKKEMESYLKAFVELRSQFRQKESKVKTSKLGHNFTSINFKSSFGVDGNLWFKLESEQYTKITANADLTEIASDISHFIKRETISLENKTEELEWWESIMECVPYLSKEKTKESRNIEITIDAAPTKEELANIFSTYNETYARNHDEWPNLGFKKKSGGGVCWLDEFVVRTNLVIASPTESKNFSAETLLKNIMQHRTRLLSPFNTESNDDTIETVITPELAANG